MGYIDVTIGVIWVNGVIDLIGVSGVKDGIELNVGIEELE